MYSTNLSDGDGGTIEGGFTWFGRNSVQSIDSSMMFFSTRSDLKPKKKGTLLDTTQKLIDSAPSYGGAKWKHAGNAIDQVSKVFNDGYKNISKGSRVVDFIPGEVVWNCVEYCRAWTKDRPYWKYSDLVKSEGNQWKNTNSILDATYNLNIAPTNHDGGKSTSMPDGTKVKKYMFSIENLAWRGTGEQSNLPASEKGPNGGRVMWFPPYDIQVGDTNSASWSPTNFLGRPEPIYTYNNSERLGTLSFKIVVDHPSTLNAIIDTQLRGMPDAEADAVLESFFAGCRKYDVYTLAQQYPNLGFEFINQVQVALVGGSKDVTTDVNSDPENTVLDNSSSEKTLGGYLSVEQAAEIEKNQNKDEEDASINVDNVNQGNTNGTFRIGAQSKRATMTSIIRKLLGEANYFTFLREQYPFLYQSLRDNLKFFHPAFHAMTPEGLNSRTTFLLQCTRPGKTIPTVTEQGTSMVDADNTAFGPPPVCVLRIGDFYHSKVAFDSMSFSYDENLLDLNPEGIGVQPMIVSVQSNFKFIGGQSLEGPVSKLQNALSFSYFANTELYDERAQPQTIPEATMSLDQIADNFVNFFKKPEGGTTTLDGETAPSLDAPLSSYYVGSKNTEPGLIQSPIEATPRDVFGRQVKALVYGPSEVYKEFDNVDGRALWRYYQIGPLGRAIGDGGTIEGGFTWFGRNSVQSIDSSMMFFSTRSDLKPKKKGTLLDTTQKLIDSAPSYGGAKWKHAGNAIDQVSKVFNDGYKNISKGSRVVDFIPGEVVWNCVEYCRAWTKDRPYWKYSDLVKSEGNQWKNTNSILDATYNLNIAPTNHDGGKSTSMPDGTKVKKYMFSIESSMERYW